MDDNRIGQLPRWAREEFARLTAKIIFLEDRLKALERIHPVLCEPSRNWFMIHPKWGEDETPIFTLERSGANRLCTLYPEDVLFVGRGK